MSHKDETPPFRTSDLSLAAYLQVCGVQLVDVEHLESLSGRPYSEFVFDGKTTALYRRRWVSGEDQVSASAYATALKRLKHVVMARI